VALSSSRHSQEQAALVGNDSGFDKTIELLAIGLVLFAPAAYGAVEPWSEEVVIAATAAIALTFCVKLLLSSRTPFVWSWTYLPIVLFLLLVVFQLLPLPFSVIRLLSPNTAALKTHLLSDISPSPARWMTVSFYPWATCHDLRLLMSIVVIYVVSLNVFCTSQRIKRVLAGISIVGGLISLLALAQDLSGTDKIYWFTVDQYIYKATAGPFVHYNHYAQFMNVAVGAGIGLLLVLMEERRIKRKRFSLEFGALEPATIGLIFLWAFVALGIASVYLSRSRSGTISLTVALCAVLIPVGRRWGRTTAGWTSLAVLALVFTVILLAGFDSVTSRLETLRHPVTAFGGRLQIVKDVLVEWRSFPILGTGLGTHLWVYPMFIRFPATFTFTHAENEFAQMLVETGAMGLSLVLFFLGLIYATVFRLLHHPQRPLHFAAYGLGMALLAVNIQSLADFGQHLLGDAVVFSIVLALIVSLRRIRQPGQQNEADETPNFTLQRPNRTLVLRMGLLTSVIALFSWGLSAADRSRRSTAEFAHAQHLGKPVMRNGWQASDVTYAEITNSLWSAAHIDPDNVEYRYWLGLYQWNEVLRRHDPNSPDDAFSESDRRTLKQLVDDFNAIRRLCPTYGLPASLGGQISLFVLDDRSGAEAIRISNETAANNPSVAEIAASMFVKIGDLPSALRVCRHYLTLVGEPPPPIVPANIFAILVHEAKRPDLAIELARDNPDRLEEIVPLLLAETGRPDYQTLAATIEKKAQAARRAELIIKCNSDDASAEDLAGLAEIYRSEHDLNHSIDCYQRALAKQYDRMDWHLNLAQALLAAGRTPEAVEEASICLRRRPHWDAAEQLIAQADSHGETPDKP
jgi:O-antigen ligase/tetratricopeptide (TPR) repeat protein